MIPFSHCHCLPRNSASPQSGQKNLALWRAAFATVLIASGLLAHQAVAQDLGIGLYRNGQLVEHLGNIQVPEAAQPALSAPGAKKRLALQGAARTASAVAAPQVSAEAQRRNAAFASSAQTASAIRDLLRQMKDKPGKGTPADRQQVQTLLAQFVTGQQEVRAVLTETANRLVQLGLDPIIVERQRQTMDHFEQESAALQKLVNDVTSGAPNAIDQALLYLEKQKFQQIPSLEKATPTHRTYVAQAPRLTREEAGALGVTPRGSSPTQPHKSVQPKTTALKKSGPAVDPSTSSPPTPADLAPTIDVQITPAITAKAAALGNSPLAIYEFVRNNIKFQPYLGSRKGSDFTLQQLAGNDTDQASLLLALLRAAAIPSRYVRGSVEMTPEQAKGWLGVDDAGTAGNILTTAGLDGVNIVNGTTVTAVQCTRVWVEAYVPYSNYRGVPNENTGQIWVPLDPAFKGSIITPGEDVLAAMGFDTDAFLADYISTFHSLSPIEKLQADIQTWLNVNRPGETVADIERTIAIAPQALGLLPASLPYQALSISSHLSELEDAKRYKIRFNLYDGSTTFIDYTINLPELAPKKLTIHYVGATPADQATIDSHGGIYQTPPNLVNVKPVLKLDDTIVATSANSIGMGYTHSSDMQFIQPTGDQNQQPLVQNEITAGNSQAIAFDTFLDVPSDLFTWASFGSGPAAEALLHPTAADYLSRVDRGMDKAARVMRTVTTQDVSEAIVESSVKVLYSFGVPTTFEWTGLTVDADRRIVGPFAVNGDQSKDVPYMKLTGYDGSNMENRVFEDTFGQQAISTIKILELANDAGIGVCTITSSIADCPGLSQPNSVISAINTALGKGHQVTIPRSPITVALWSGTGYIDLDPTTGAAGYIISGGISGSVMVAGGSTVDVWPIDLGCEPIGDVTGEIIPGGFTDGGVLCADDSSIGYGVDLEYDCLDADGNIQHQTFGASHAIPLTTLEIVEAYGPGTYTISIPDAVVNPVSFTLVHVEFTEDQDTTCWQQGGTYNAKAFLSSDSTTDDSLLSWTISPNDAAVDSHGLVRFGPGGNDYTVTVMAGAIAVCSESFTLTVAKLKTETVATTPADRKRTRLGVGEEVVISVEPSTIGTVTWSATGSGKVDPVTSTFTASDSAGAASVMATFANGAKCDAAFTVVAPTTQTATKVSDLSFTAGTQGAGMTLRFTFGPADVSFKNVEILEVAGPASNITDYFKTYPANSLAHHPNSNFVSLDQNNQVCCDTASFSGYPAPWSAGGFEWVIPVQWRVIGNATAKNFANDEVQTFSINGADGSSTVTKLGQSSNRTP